MGHVAKGQKPAAAPGGDELLAALPWGIDNLIQTTQVLVVGLDRGGTIRIFNQAAEKLTGYTRVELEGRNWFEVVCPRERYPQVWAEFEHLERGEPPCNFENPILTKTGEERYVLWQNDVVREKGQVTGSISLGLDITERRRAEELLRLTQFSVDRAADSVFWTDADGHLVYVSDATCRSHGYSRDEMLTMTLFDLDPSLSREQWNWATVKERGSVQLESVHRTKEGKIFPVDVHANYVHYEDKEYNCVFARDITERKQTEESLRLTQLSVDRAADLIHWIAPDGRLLYVSDSTCLRHGYSREELLGMTIFDLDPLLTPTTWARQWQETCERGSLSLETVHRTKLGKLFPVEVVVNYIRHGQAECNFAFARDISERKKAEQDLREANRELLKAQDALTRQARTDALTGCLNHGAVLSRLDEELDRARRSRSSLAVGMIDVDRFKNINDTYGHLAGDQVLCEVVARSLSALRPYDVFGRFGGEEFLVVISAAEEGEARSVLERIRAAIAQEPVVVEGRKIPVSVSIGGALWRKESSTDFIRLADQALYRAKDLGRNRLVVHDSGLDAYRALCARMHVS